MTVGGRYNRHSVFEKHLLKCKEYDIDIAAIKDEIVIGDCYKFYGSWVNFFRPEGYVLCVTKIIK